ncbi:hypothetical protein DICVIV_12638 [Dictyocaulus viviparus]|uniref:Uncharacterized protein n=1 Tax=Dictyocaulus viviparus TaxID=29172 RepID=A0A0D8XC89_DICVI|nr:hypothetical protein DICVIV_12638 [Dictyocaulus viviparus]
MSFKQNRPVDTSKSRMKSEAARRDSIRVYKSAHVTDSVSLIPSQTSPRGRDIKLYKKNTSSPKKENDSVVSENSFRNKDLDGKKDVRKSAESVNSVRSNSSQKITVEKEQKVDVIVQRLQEFAWMTTALLQCDQTSVEQLRHEFDSLPLPDMRVCKAGAEPRNVKKNRYSSEYCVVTLLMNSFHEVEFFLFMRIRNSRLKTRSIFYLN